MATYTTAVKAAQAWVAHVNAGQDDTDDESPNHKNGIPKRYTGKDANGEDIFVTPTPAKDDALPTKAVTPAQHFADGQFADGDDKAFKKHTLMDDASFFDLVFTGLIQDVLDAPHDFKDPDSFYNHKKLYVQERVYVVKMGDNYILGAKIHIEDKKVRALFNEQFKSDQKTDPESTDSLDDKSDSAIYKKLLKSAEDRAEEYWKLLSCPKAKEGERKPEKTTPVYYTKAWGKVNVLFECMKRKKGDLVWRRDPATTKEKLGYPSGGKSFVYVGMYQVSFRCTVPGGAPPREPGDPFPSPGVPTPPGGVSTPPPGVPSPPEGIPMPLALEHTSTEGVLRRFLDALASREREGEAPGPSCRA